ncbi:MAG: hypothetical protein HKN84_07805 [Gammaproteobacteria bacterium]|nr:hypothetical protein [Gammaproteobacteria bacterium]
MRNTSLLSIIVLTLSFSSASVAQSWIEYSDPNEYFGVNFPTEPEIEQFTFDSDFNAVYPGRRYTVYVGESSYSVSVVDFTDAQQILLDMEKTEAASGPTNWIYDQRASVARAARQIRERGGEITWDNWSHLDRVEGHMIQMTNDDGSRTFAGIYLNSNRARLYISEATVPAGSPPPIQFQQSLHFLDDEGDRIRYLLSTNGCALDPNDPRIEMPSVR